MTPIDDLPREVAELIDRHQQDAVVIRDKVTSEIARIREKAEEEIDTIRRKSEQKIKLKSIALIDQIKPLQESYLKEHKLDEALAIRDAIRTLRRHMLQLRPDPGNLLEFRDKLNELLVFEVIGSAQGPLWGTELYTIDSSVATAAVHAGLLSPGQKGVVQVVIEDSSTVPEFEGSQRHGVWSGHWGPYPLAFRIGQP